MCACVHASVCAHARSCVYVLNAPGSPLRQEVTSSLCLQSGKKKVNTEPGGTHSSADDAWEEEAAAKAQRQMMMGMVAGVIFGIVTLIVCCVMWKLCCGKLCDQNRQKIMPMDFRGADQLQSVPPPPPMSAHRPRSSRHDRH